MHIKIDFLCFIKAFDSRLSDVLGNGECEAGKCKCFADWEGDRCQCSLQSAKQCLNSKGQICSGRGNCVCGKCECTDPRSFGRLCEYCPACNKACEENW